MKEKKEPKIEKDGELKNQIQARFEINSELKNQIQTKIKMNLSGVLRGMIVGGLVLLQFMMILVLPYLLSSFTVYFYACLELLSVAVTIGLVNDNRSPSYKLGWICTALIFPISGHIMYVLWGAPGTNRKMESIILAKLRRGATFLPDDSKLNEEYEQKNVRLGRMSRYLSSQSFPLFKNNQINYYPMGEDVFAAIFEDMRKAKKFILIDFFIVAEGVLWDEFHQIFKEKIAEGVEIKFLYDDFGAMFRTSKFFKRDLEQEGVSVRIFNPIHKYTEKLYMNYRSHQKIVVIDGNIGYTGGMNIADEYANIIERFGKWKDNAVRIEGEGVWGLTVTFLQMWEVSGSGEFLDYNPYRPDCVFEENEVYCHVISDGPANNPDNPIENIYKQMIQYAGRYLYITTPYLLIEDDVKEALVVAAQSGIDVRIITPFIPDKKSVRILTNYNYGILLKRGVRIFEYTPGFIHAKTILNESCGIVGTVNMDYRSFYLHYECGVWFSGDDTIDIIKQDLLDTMKQSAEITYDEWKQRPLWLKMIQPVLNLFSTLM